MGLLVGGGGVSTTTGGWLQREDLDLRFGAAVWHRALRLDLVARLRSAGALPVFAWTVDSDVGIRAARNPMWSSGWLVWLADFWGANEQ